MSIAPIYWWKLEDATGEIGGQDFAVDTGTTVYGAAKFNNGAVFVGTNSLYGAGIQVPSGGAAWTVEFWIYRNVISGAFRRWFTNTTGGVAANSLLIREHSGNTINIYFGTTSYAGTTIPYKQWFHLAVTHNGTTGYVYLNGVEVSGGVTSTTNPAAGMYLGGHYGAGEYFIGRIDNLKIYNYAKTDFSDRFYEDGEIPVFAETVVETQQKPQVLLRGIDLYELGYVKNIINIDEYKTFRRDKLIENEYTLEVKNFDDYFSVDNSKSILNGYQWQYSTLKIINESGITIWDGLVEDITRDHNTKIAEIKSISALSKYENINIAYASADWETPADAIKNIMDAYGFTYYDSASLSEAISILTDEACYVKCNIEAKDNMNFMSAMEKLAEYSCSDCYVSKGILCFKHYRPFTGNVKVELQEKDLIQSPIVSSTLAEIINDYNIGYDACGDVPATDSNQGNIGSTSRSFYGTKCLPEMKSDVNAQIKFKDATSAKYIGECYIKRTHKSLSEYPVPLTQIVFSISYDFKNYFDLQTYFKLTLSDESWTDKIFEVFRITIDEEQHIINLTAIEVDV